MSDGERIRLLLSEPSAATTRSSTATMGTLWQQWRPGPGMRRHGDAWFVVLAVLHGVAMLAVPAVPLIAAGVWWSSNTIAHNFIHRPFFRSPRLNVVFSAYQSVLTGIPQTLWRERHLAHHAGVRWQARWSTQLLAELGLIGALWTVLATSQPSFFATVYLPGYLAGLMLCALQGHYEHAGATTSHYGRVYNLLFFNDGYHVEHHAHPGVHWTELPYRIAPGAHSSRWPAVLRWLGVVDLEWLERLVLRSRVLQRLVIAAHRRAFRAALAGLAPLRRVTIVGGGLFPRTALVLRELVPSAELVIIDANARHLDIARVFIEQCDEGIRHAVHFQHARFTAGALEDDVDLLVIPLSFQGDRDAIYSRPPARAVLVHDWLWKIRGSGYVVSVLLLKRLNLVRP